MERGKSAGLLEPERGHGVPRPEKYAEAADVSGSASEEGSDAAARGISSVRQQRVGSRRRGRSRFASRFSWSSRWVRFAVVATFVAAVALVAAAGFEMKSFMLHNPRFLLPSTANIQVAGDRVVTAREVRALFAPDAGHSIFRLPMAQRQAELQQMPWVRRATVMRSWPDRLSVQILERTPIAFARDGDRIRLIDEEGVLLDLPEAAAQHDSFPVLTGVSGSVPLAARAARIATYRRFEQAIDAEGGNISATLSEVDLSDPEDVRAVFAGGARQPMVHFGDSNFLPRYRAYQSHLAEWLRQYPMLRSVDMRYGRQVVLDTGEQTAAAVAPASAPVSAAASLAERPVHGPTPKPRAHRVKARTASLKRVKKTPRTSERKRRPRMPERGHPVRHPIMHVVSGM